MRITNDRTRERKEAPATGVPTLEVLKQAFIQAEFWRLAALDLPTLSPALPVRKAGGGQ